MVWLSAAAQGTAPTSKRLQGRCPTSLAWGPASLLICLRLGRCFLQRSRLTPSATAFALRWVVCPAGDSDLEILEESSSARPLLQNAMGQPPTPQQVQLSEKYDAQVKRRDQVSWCDTHLGSACTASAQKQQGHTGAT